MKLTPELEQASRALGASLHENPAVQAYLKARQRVGSDSEAPALERELYATYETLLARQQAGEQIPREEIEAFYSLRTRFFAHPLVAERENALTPVKSLFAEVAVEIGSPLGVDYTLLAKEE